MQHVAFGSHHQFSALTEVFGIELFHFAPQHLELIKSVKLCMRYIYTVHDKLRSVCVAQHAHAPLLVLRVPLGDSRQVEEFHLQAVFELHSS